MKLKGLVLVSIAVLLSTSGAANAGGAKFLTELFQLGRKAERPALEFVTTSGRRYLNELSGVSKTELDNLASRLGISKPELYDLATHGRATKVSSLYDGATSQILDDLQNYLNANTQTALTQQRLEGMINAAVTKIIETTAKETNSGLSFEMLTGRLKIERSYTGSLGRVTAGEINIYKVSGAVASAVYVCKELVDRAQFNACVKEALGKVKTIVTEEMQRPSLLPDAKLQTTATPNFSD
jgi:hypothetical protein